MYPSLTHTSAYPASRMPSALRGASDSPVPASPDSGDPPLSGIHAIQLRMNQWVRQHHVRANITNWISSDALRLEQAILTDALTFLALLAAKQHRPPVSESLLPVLERELAGKRINFNRVVHTGARLLNLPALPDFSEWIHQNPNFRSDPVLRTELDLFVNRGNFQWRNYGDSRFRDFLRDIAQAVLPEDACINCWEAVLYSMLRGGGIDRMDLINLYISSRDHAVVLDNLSKAFRWETSKQVLDKKQFVKAAKYNPYFIEVCSPGTDRWPGLDHDMVSFPGSTTKILQTLISGAYQGRPDQKPTFYSHWELWTASRVGNPAPREALDYMLSEDTHIIPLQVFFHLFPRISAAAQQLNRHT